MCVISQLPALKRLDKPAKSLNVSRTGECRLDNVSHCFHWKAPEPHDFAASTFFGAPKMKETPVRQGFFQFHRIRKRRARKALGPNRP
jgi:hypothetical protein